ncbi:MAG: PAS domain S-box protein [Aquamicrobium sp.]|nr:PAS domain S-box protein [Aquamicrobium sp.]
MDKREEGRIEKELHQVAASTDPFAAAVRTTRMPMLITDPHGPDNPIVFSNDAFSRLTGYSRQETLGQNCRFLQGDGTNFDDVTKVRNAIARREAIEIDLLNYRKDGSSFWNRLLISPVFDDGGALTYFFASQFDVSPERNRLAELHTSHEVLENQIEKRVLDLTASENRLRFILKAAGMGTWTLDINAKRLVCSPQCKENFGRPPEEPFTYGELEEAIDPSDIEGWKEALANAAKHRRELQVECRVRTPDGDRRWIEIRGQMVSTGDGASPIMTGITQDITERKEAEEHRKLLARELNHRVKNTLATVQSVFAQSLRSAKNLDEARAIAFGRIQAMSTAQDILTQEGWSSADLRTVVAEALTPFNGADIRFGGPRVVLTEQAVSAFSLALHELATNASKYGALSASGGSVTIHWEIERNGHRTLRFYWSEMGGPEVREPATRGFGSKLIEGVLATALGGSAAMTFRSSGLLFEVEAALPDDSDQAPSSNPHD